MPVQRLQEFLDEHQVKYVVVSHSRAFTTQEIAAATHIPGKELAKSVIVEIDGRMAMAVVPGSQKVDLDLFRDVRRRPAGDVGQGERIQRSVPRVRPGRDAAVWQPVRDASVRGG
jgi:Ala-tRNA(Pro) deacylase